MSPEELKIQREGYAAAISSPAVIQAIQSGAYGRIALTFFEWAGSYHAREIIDWTVIESPEQAIAFADKLLENRSMPASRTSISGAIRYASLLFESLELSADRRVIDISGDGPNNEGLPVTIARDEALAEGLVINGLPLLTRGGFYSSYNIDDLDEYYRACVIGGPASFVVPVTAWEHFPEAVRRKLVLEIGAVDPSPLTPDFPSVNRDSASIAPAQYQPSAEVDCLIGEKIWQRRREIFRDP